MTAINPRLAAAIAAQGVPLSADPAPSERGFSYRTERFEVMFPATGVSDLTDPVTRRTLHPTSVRLELVRKETHDEGVREWAHVAVYGPRRLVSGDLGREISSFGWESARNEGRRGYVARPVWLTLLLADHRPDRWSPRLLDLPVGDERVEEATQ